MSSNPDDPLDPHRNDPPRNIGEVGVLPVLEERLHVTKRVVESGRARVHIGVSEYDEVVETALRQQSVEVDRVAIGRFVDQPPPARREGDTIVVPIIEERVVVEKRLFLKEELRIRIDETRHVETQTVTLRREHAEVEQTNASSKLEGTPS
jgi:uncharacterized protein (TIGR02271 family)